MLFLAGGKTEPIQTLLFMQASIPLSALVSSIVFGTRYVVCWSACPPLCPHALAVSCAWRRYSRAQVLGILAISTGILISLLPEFREYESTMSSS